MSAVTAECPHREFVASVAVNRLEDTGRFSADIRVRCAVCQEPFRWLGILPGLSWREPRLSIDGLELRAPIEPQGEPRLIESSATFEVPPMPLRSGEGS